VDVAIPEGGFKMKKLLLLLFIFLLIVVSGLVG